MLHRDLMRSIPAVLSLLLILVMLVNSQKKLGTIYENHSTYVLYFHIEQYSFNTASIHCHKYCGGQRSLFTKSPPCQDIVACQTL